MNYSRKLVTSLALCLLLSGYNYATENVGKGHAKTTHTVMSSGCTQDLGSSYLNINNIRARIMDEGDMWWDPGAGLPRYYAPATANTCAQFAAALWIGGYDAGNQLKVAAMTYRQNGEDFWAGPIDTAGGNNGGISAQECLNWDKMFYCTRAEVEAFHTLYPNGTITSNIPLDILNWPGSGANNGSPDASNHMAPFIDVGGTGLYDPTLGDYPAFDLTGAGYCQNELYGDACLWWVINDVGNIHSESGGVPIGLEIREQAFAFQTNDAINNMTFYHYQVINRSTFGLYKTYFGFWDDFDLGNGGDNYTGCDVGRSLGYGYCGHKTNPDGTGPFAGEYGYHNDDAAVGDVFFQGPKADKGDTNHYVKNGYIGMARFVYYNNDATVQGNPSNQTSYYKYLTGLWQDGTPMTYGGNGYGGSLPCDYMFPWTPGGACSANAVNTDPTGYGTGLVPQSAEWDEVASNDVPGDRRLLMSAGPFTLLPGAVNYVIVGCVWDQPSTDFQGNTVPLCLIQQDADLAQGLFNNCFKVVNGPDAPDMAIQELNQELILTLSNGTTSNNYKEHYAERSPTILYPPYKDTDYVFQGYEVFQLIDSTVTASELLNDNTKARLIAQCDIQDNVSQIINYVYSSSLNALVPTLEVSGSNKGIVHSFDIKGDAFSEDNQTTLVNDRPYYFMVIAYAYNNYLPYQTLPDTNQKWGQKLPFLQGRRNIRVYTAYPHIVSAQGYGTVQNSNYGSGVAITRLEGHGNGFNDIELDQNSINYIVANDTMAHPSYVPGQGPIGVKVVDPLNVVNANFIVKFIPGPKSKGVDSVTTWQLINQTTGEVDNSDTSIGDNYEQVFPQYGISITIHFQYGKYAGYRYGGYPLALDSACSISFADPHKNWLTSVQSVGPGVNLAYWIRSGVHAPSGPPYSDPDASFSSYGNFDPDEYYNQILGGAWAPYGLCAVSDGGMYCDNGPAYSGITPFSPPPPTPQTNANVADSIGNIASVDIVFTADRTKWTRCIVLEEEDSKILAQGGAGKLDLRAYYSVDQYGNFAKAGDTAEFDDPSKPNYISATGMGWFPGYAINLETGERLNMAYGEDSWLNGHFGRDMQWDPDSVLYSSGGTSGAGAWFGQTSIFGGKHYIYVFGHNHNVANGTYDYSVPAYDADKTIRTNFLNTKPFSNPWWKERYLDDIMWVNIPILNKGHALLETDATVRLRVAKPYDTAYGETFLNVGHAGGTKAIGGSTWRNPNPANNNYPMYAFSTSGLEVATNSEAAAKNALGLINVVPNPYYAYAGYETNRLDTRVRITNLPPTCTISIFTISGTLIKVINKSNPDTFIDWNLQNQFNVPIASGLYLIHVAVPNVGEVTLKWFGVMRPLDLTSY